MRILSSGVYAACCCAVGMLWSCSESSSNDISAPESNLSSSDYLESSGAGVPSNTESPNSSSGNFSGHSEDLSSAGSNSSAESSGTSSADKASSSSNRFHRNSSSSDNSGKSSAAQTNSSSSGNFTYISPSNFADTVNGTVFNMVYVAGGNYTRGCDNCAEQDKIYESPSHKVTVSDYHIAPTEVTIGQWNAVILHNKLWMEHKPLTYPLHSWRYSFSTHHVIKILNNKA